MINLKSNIAVSVIATVICLAPSGLVAQRDASSLSFTNSESGGSAEVSAVVAIEKLVAENRRLKAELENAKQVAAGATAEAEVFKRQVQEFALRMEALGASTTTPSALEQRVLQAANALRQSESARDELSKSLALLAQVASEYAKRPDAEAKLALDSELARVDDVLGRVIAGDMVAKTPEADETVPRLLSGKVSAVKSDIACIVINLGSNQGVKDGMPFEVRRGEHRVATVRVVDARQAFSGTVIQNIVSSKDSIQVGDTVMVEATQN